MPESKARKITVPPPVQQPLMLVCNRGGGAVVKTANVCLLGGVTMQGRGGIQVDEQLATGIWGCMDFG